MNFNQLGISEDIVKILKFKIPRRDLGEENHGYK